MSGSFYYIMHFSYLINCHAKYVTSSEVEKQSAKSLRIKFKGLNQKNKVKKIRISLLTND